MILIQDERFFRARPNSGTKELESDFEFLFLIFAGNRSRCVSFEPPKISLNP
jgi:hypothetical protein